MNRFIPAISAAALICVLPGCSPSESEASAPSSDTTQSTPNGAQRPSGAARNSDSNTNSSSRRYSSLLERKSNDTEVSETSSLTPSRGEATNTFADATSGGTTDSFNGESTDADSFESVSSPFGADADPASSFDADADAETTVAGEFNANESMDEPFDPFTAETGASSVGSLNSDLVDAALNNGSDVSGGTSFDGPMESMDSFDADSFEGTVPNDASGFEGDTSPFEANDLSPEAEAAAKEIEAMINEVDAIINGETTNSFDSNTGFEPDVSEMGDSDSFDNDSFSDDSFDTNESFNNDSFEGTSNSGFESGTSNDFVDESSFEGTDAMISDPGAHIEGEMQTVSSGPMNMLEIVDFMNDNNVVTSNSTTRLPSDQFAALKDAMNHVGAVNVAYLDTDVAGQVIALQFTDERSLNMFVQTQPEMTYLAGMVLIPTGPVTEGWNTLVEMFEQNGGMHIQSMHVSMRLLEFDVKNVRVQIERFQSGNNGDAPNFEATQWDDLMAGGFIHQVPHNPLSAPGSSSRVMIVTQAGVDGSTVDPATAGWVWNTSDQAFFAAGISDTNLQAFISATSSDVPHVTIPSGTPNPMTSNATTPNSFSTPSTPVSTGDVTADTASVKATLETFRSLIELHQSTHTNDMGEAVSPTLAELMDLFNGSVPNNPFNDSNMIQEAYWSDYETPVMGIAGWNYDSESGRFWANTKVAGACDF